ncbi:MAG: L,D-transpeptidase [Verrucomicrobia bacterium]|nr:L,D-transpeptidase [Verrucomicrobiota bacterium]MBV9673485.1 L,D-transpeptidase [Verrucomicrobiota bacterium]
MRFSLFFAVYGFLQTCLLAQYSIDLDLTEQRVYLLYNGRAIMESPVSSGRPGHQTPTGTFRIAQKDPNHVSSIYGRIVDRYGNTVVLDADVDMTRPVGTRFVNAPMRYFMEFAPGIGLHAGYLPGYPASHGCVRMPEQYAIAFYQAISVGTPVTVFGTAPRVRQYQASFSPSSGSRYYDRNGQEYYPGRVISTPAHPRFWPF